MRRRKLLVALVGLAVVVTGAAFALWPSRNRITRENCDRVTAGMTRAEVYAILGPPSDNTSGPVRVAPESLAVCAQLNAQRDLPSEEWETDKGFAHATFDRQERVVGIVYVPCNRISQGFFENLMWRVERVRYNWYKQRGLIVE
jgi:hypothetical protein